MAILALQRRLLDPVRRVLVLQTAWLGDTVFTSSLVAGLLQRFPGVPLDVCTSQRGHDVARAMPGVADVIVFDKKGRDQGPLGLWSVARTLKARGYDLAVLPHRSVRSGSLAALARIPNRLGLQGAPGRPFYTAAVPDPGGTFVGRENVLLTAIGGTPQPARLVPTPAHLATRHPTPHTPHPTPDTRHPTPDTRHPTIISTSTDRNAAPR